MADQDDTAPTTDASHPWFRYYNGTAGDRKLRRVASETGVMRALVLGVWAGLMELANMSPVWGCLLDDDGTPLTVALMAEDIGIAEETLRQLLECFERRDMLTRTDGALHLTHWDKRQFQSDSSTERVRRYRERQRQQEEPPQADTATLGDGEAQRSGNVTGTHQSQTTQPETHAETHAEGEKRGTTGATAPAAVPPPAQPPPDTKPKRDDPRGDGRHSLPAIQAAKGVNGGHYPPRELWDDIIARLGTNPDGKRLAECRKAWRARGYNPNAWTWLLEWYRDGIPKQPNGSKGRAHNPEPGERDFTGGKYGKAVAR